MKIDIRFSDMDSQGHVHHEAMVGWVAAARVAFIDEAVEGVKNIDYTLVHLSMDFQGEITHPGVVKVAAFVRKIGNKSLRLEYSLSKDGVGFATAESVTVFYDTRTKRTIRVPDKLREVLDA